MTPARQVEVRRGERLVLTARDTPGTLRSTAAPPPPPPVGEPWRPPSHPFIDAQAHDAASESRLRELLDESESFDDYLDRLRGDGFDIREA